MQVTTPPTDKEGENVSKAKENQLAEWFTKTLGFRVEVGPALEGGTVDSTRSSVMLVTHSTPRKYRPVPGNELEAITSAGADAVRLIDRLKAELRDG